MRYFKCLKLPQKILLFFCCSLFFCTLFSCLFLNGYANAVSGGANVTVDAGSYRSYNSPVGSPFERATLNTGSTPVLLLGNANTNTLQGFLAVNRTFFTGISWQEYTNLNIVLEVGTSTNANVSVWNAQDTSGEIKCYVYLDNGSNVNVLGIETRSNNRDIYQCNVNLPENTKPTSIDFRVGNWSNASAAPIYYANSSTGQIQIKNFHIDYTTDLSPATQALTQITQQNQTIINQNQSIINQQQTANNISQQTQDYLTDDTPASVNTGNLPSVGLLPAGPLDSLLGLPITLMTSISSSLGGSCSPVSLTLPFVDKTLSLPCFDSIFYSGDFAPLANIIGVAASAVILYEWLKHLYKKVDRATSLQTSDEDEWGLL